MNLEFVKQPEIFKRTVKDSPYISNYASKVKRMKSKENGSKEGLKKLIKAKTKGISDENFKIYRGKQIFSV